MGIELAPEVASELVAQKRQQGTDIRIAGNYRVTKVDTTVPEGLPRDFARHENE
jgi:hypothetical protein